jgi:transposase
VAEGHVAGSKKKACEEGRTLVFVDESGLSERPSLVRTWAPKGETPQLTFSFTWKQLSVMAGITWWQFYFRFYRGAVRGPQAVDFLRHLRRQLRGRLLIIWDGLSVHRSRVVRQWVAGTHGEVWLAQLPAYAPELNPVEYVWGHLKQHALANFCASDLAHLSRYARSKLRSAQRRPQLVRAFWHQAELAL